MDKKQRPRTSNLMKEEEEIAQAYLYTISDDVVPWPDGRNVPPDFKINEIIAVEVRRLSKNIIKRNIKPKSLEQDAIPLFHALSKVFREFDSSISDNKYWIYLHFFRPIGKISNIELVAKTELDNFLKNKRPTPYEIKLSRTVSFTIEKGNIKSNKVFDIGMISDLNHGGFVEPMYIENIKHCIAEKTPKIQAYKSKYSEWWLLLVDFLVGGIGESEKTTVIQHINKSADWKRIIVLDPITKKEIIKID